MRNRIPNPFVLLVWGVCALAAAQDDPFRPSVTLEPVGPREGRMTVSFPVPEGYSLYAATISVEVLNGHAELSPREIPEGKKELDPFSDPPKEREIYAHDFALRYAVRLETGRTFEVAVSYQGCTERTCFLPATRNFTLTLPGEPEKEEQPPAGKKQAAPTPEKGGESGKKTAPRPERAGGAEPPDGGWREMIGGFAIAGTQVGFVGPESFLAFLNEAESPGAGESRGPARFEKAGLFLLIVLALAGGLLLNLTPCVLPMIPINIAVIGAGAQGGSRSRGLALGAAYGAGIALTYGILGLAVVVAGGRFGTLNSAPWFNFAIAALFAILALAMFGVFNMDLARFRRDGGGPRKTGRGSYVLAGFMGAVAALLGGACVAPAVLAALLLARNLYAAGHASAALLPFLLGVGMGLPWPFAGAGLSFLPKPGRWMTWVKNGFGVFILATALYYGHLGWSLLGGRATEKEAAEVAARQRQQTEERGWLDSLTDALRLSKELDKPVLLDFWATWCKNCLVMDQVTFKDPAVRKRLESFVKVKVQLEDFRDPEVKEILRRFDIVGLPTYMALKP